ncbi:MAG: hypothetical protein R2786_08475 [Flavobacteriaceae bacterium]
MKIISKLLFAFLLVTVLSCRDTAKEEAELNATLEEVEAIDQELESISNEVETNAQELEETLEELDSL